MGKKHIVTVVIKHTMLVEGETPEESLANARIEDFEGDIMQNGSNVYYFSPSGESGRVNAKELLSNIKVGETIRLEDGETCFQHVFNTVVSEEIKGDIRSEKVGPDVYTFWKIETPYGMFEIVSNASAGEILTVTKLKAAHLPQETLCISGPLSVGDAVLSSPDSDYPLLYGFVTDIRPVGSCDRDTDNETDDIYVEFSIDDLSDERIICLNKHFARLYGEEYKERTPICADSVIMAPNELKRVALSVEEFDEMCESVEKARALFNAAD